MDAAASSFEEFYLTARDRCLRTVLAVVGDRALAEESVAEAMCRAWGAWHTLRDHPAPQAWVVRTALNLNVSWWRRRRREVPFDRVPPRDRDIAERPVPEPVDPRWMAALRQLPDRQRQVLAIRILLDLDTAQTAELLGLAPATVRVHLHRAAAALRAELGHLIGSEREA